MYNRTLATLCNSRMLALGHLYQNVYTCMCGLVLDIPGLYTLIHGMLRHRTVLVTLVHGILTQGYIDCVWTVLDIPGLSR